MWNDPAWAFGIAFVIVALSLRKALPRLLNSIADSHTGPPQLEAGATPEDVEELRRRLGELEERVDFTERMVARQQEHSRLPPSDR